MPNSSVLQNLSNAVSQTAYFVRGIAYVSVTAALVAFSTSSVKASVISNGALTVDIRDDNGAINSVLFGGSEFYQEGTFISDFGFQLGDNVSTFAINTAYGNVGLPVTINGSGGFISASGQYNKGGAAIDFTRTYSLVPGLNVLRVATNFLNKGPNTVFRYFDTLDPDQGIDQGTGFPTYNDVFSVTTGAGQATVGQATELNGLTVDIGSLDPNVTVASGSPFNIGDGYALNNFFSSPFDGNGTYDDQGTHIGLQKFLATGSALSFTYDQAFGSTPDEAQRYFFAANDGGYSKPDDVFKPVPSEDVVKGNNPQTRTDISLFIQRSSKPVPEPPITLAAIIALGFGTLFKRELAKKKQNSHLAPKNIDVKTLTTCKE